MQILVLAGPTSAGKTAAAIELAKEWHPRIVSADAMQVYRGMDIGTGKLSPDWLERYPHAAIDIRDPHEHFNAVDFAELADGEIAKANTQGRPVLIVGGTGFYFRALLEGFVEAPSGSEALREDLEAIEDLHGALAEVDPVLAKRLHPHDRVRLVRGLEVFRLTGQPLSALHAEHAPTPRHPAVCLLLDRADLKERIDARVLEMLEAGYLDEVRTLRTKGYTPAQTKPMRSLGYRHLSDHLEGAIDLVEATRRTQRDTRKFAKRQRNILRSIGGFEPCEAQDMDRIRAAAQRAWGSPPAKASAGS
jgi:tRNA dimethylallyltransferase